MHGITNPSRPEEPEPMPEEPVLLKMFLLRNPLAVEEEVAEVVAEDTSR